MYQKESNLARCFVFIFVYSKGRSAAWNDVWGLKVWGSHDGDYITVFWDVTPCTFVKIYQRFKGLWCCHCQERSLSQIFVAQLIGKPRIFSLQGGRAELQAIRDLCLILKVTLRELFSDLRADKERGYKKKKENSMYTMFSVIQNSLVCECLLPDD
jgi:hypothetical protein